MAKASVLVADDDKDFRQAVAEFIEMEGWQVWQAQDGEEALDFARAYKPDVIILDQRMPGLTGTEVILHMRDRGIHTPVVFISAAREISALALSVSVNCYLQKPFGINDLITLLNQALQGGC